MDTLASRGLAAAWLYTALQTTCLQILFRLATWNLAQHLAQKPRLRLFSGLLLKQHPEDVNPGLQCLGVTQR